MTNSVATLTGMNAATFLENTVNATPQLLDADVIFGDLDGNVAGGALTVSGLLAEDTVSIRNQGVGAGQIGFSGGLVSYEGALIGVAAGGAGGTLTVALIAGATSAAVDALIQNLTFATSSDAPPASHGMEIKVTDGAGDILGDDDQLGDRHDHDHLFRRQGRQAMVITDPQPGA